MSARTSERERVWIERDTFTIYRERHTHREPRRERERERERE